MLTWSGCARMIPLLRLRPASQGDGLAHMSNVIEKTARTPGHFFITWGIWPDRMHLRGPKVTPVEFFIAQQILLQYTLQDAGMPGAAA
jgi:hypothetical protein